MDSISDGTLLQIKTLKKDIEKTSRNEGHHTFSEKRIGGGSSENEQSKVEEKVENFIFVLSFRQTL